MDLSRATDALARGEPILLYDADGREEETDIVVASQHCTPATLRRLRNDAGGLVCTTIAPEHHRALGLPFLHDMLEEASTAYPALAHLPGETRYDANPSSFGITINHRSTFTGISDTDRATTITELAAFLADGDLDPKAFGAEFRAPGHVILLNGHPSGLAARQGHTELSIELARMAGVVPSTTICEMLGPDGNALPRAAAEEYARAHGLVFLTGQDILDAHKAKRTRANPVPRPRTA